MKNHKGKKQKTIKKSTAMQIHKVSSSVWQYMIENFIDKKSYHSLCLTNKYWRDICFSSQQKLLKKWRKKLDQTIWDVIGLVQENYVADHVIGHNCNFEIVPTLDVRYHLYCRNFIHTIELFCYTKYGQCFFVWGTSSVGVMYAKLVDKIGPITHEPKTKLSFILNLNELQWDEKLQIKYDINNTIFELSFVGLDKYYPRGYVKLNMGWFCKTIRFKSKRMVWIWKGPSCVGKSHLSQLISGKTIYETDSNSFLPNFIHQDIIIIGNKYKFSEEEIKERIVIDAEIHIVQFD